MSTMAIIIATLSSYLLLHGTNPASAVVAGLQVVVTACDEQGNIIVEDIRAKAEMHRDHLAALMVTYPSTHGVFETSIKEVCQIVHDNGGLVYMDGANMNARSVWPVRLLSARMYAIWIYIRPSPSHTVEEDLAWDLFASTNVLSHFTGTRLPQSESGKNCGIRSVCCPLWFGEYSADQLWIHQNAGWWRHDQ